ncbi:MAG: signal peptide peptidase SppA [Gemmatimonadetes bacterium]|nr:MAG: signal peptide peptidase SppA [Gemmatimonadota bacterium]
MRLSTVFTSLLMLGLWVISAPAQLEFPTYHTQTDFALASPGGFRTGSQGYLNPAVLAYVHQGDLVFSFSDPGDSFKTYRQVGFSFAVPNFSFNLLNEKIPGLGRITNYNLALSWGGRRSSVGLGYHWATDTIGGFERKTRVTLGSLYRPNRYLSAGLTTTLATNSRQREYAGDLALRPLGDETLTLFGDYGLQEHSSVEEGHWSVGGIVELLDGMRLTARYFDTEAFNVGVNFSFGHESVTMQSHYDAEQEHLFNSYSVRLGGRERSVIRDRYLHQKRFIRVEMNGSLRYQTYQWFDDGKTLMDYIDWIQQAKEDPAVGGMMINLSGMKINREMLWELRQELLDFQSTGKTVIMYADRLGIDEYHFASVADQLVLDPEGMITLEGYLMGLTFIKGTLDKLGLAFDEWRYFKYKSAAEALSREGMSDGDREQRQALVDDYYQLAKDDICASRSLDPAELDRIINEEVLLSPQEALDAGLIDEIARWEGEGQELLETIVGKDKKLVSSEALVNTAPPVYPYWGEPRRIAVVYALGICAMDEGIKARQLSRVIEKIAKDTSIKAVILRVDSPGGDGLASDLVAEALRKCKEAGKPVVVSQGYVAASGGYWLSMYGDVIVAAPNTITGSIGVIGGWLYNAGIKESLGMTTDHVRVGDHADLGFGIRMPYLGWQIPDRNLNAEEQAEVETLIKSHYDVFVKKVAEGRGLPADEIEEIAQGRVWSGLDGMEIGLVDELGGLSTAIRLAKEKASIPADEPVTLVSYPRKGLVNVEQFMPRLLGVDLRTGQPDVLDYIQFRLEHNGQPLLMLPLEQMEGNDLFEVLKSME